MSAVELTDAKAAEALKVWQTPRGRAVLDAMKPKRKGENWTAGELLTDGCFMLSHLEIIHEACLAVLTEDGGGQWPTKMFRDEWQTYCTKHGWSDEHYSSYDAALLAAVAQALGLVEPKVSEPVEGWPPPKPGDKYHIGVDLGEAPAKERRQDKKPAAKYKLSDKADLDAIGQEE